jgi:anti-sigma B factor antagonist
METAVGVFKSREKAELALKELIDRKVPHESIAFLTTSETEAVSVAKEVGTYAGGFLGGAAGMTAGVVATTILLIPGLGQAFAIGLGATALFGLAGARAGSAVAKAAADESAPMALPDNEDAALFRKVLKDGHSVIIVRTEWKEVANAAVQVLDRMSVGSGGKSSTKMQANAREIGDVSVVDVKGRITLGEGNEILRELITELTAQGKTRIVCNLLEVDHIDSAGIGELVRAHSTLRRQGGQLKLASPSGKVKDVLKMTSLHSVFDIHENEASAVKSFGSSAAAAS